MADEKFSATAPITTRSGLDYVMGQQKNSDGSYSTGKVPLASLRGFSAVTAQTAAYTMLLGDVGALTRLTSTSAVNFTIPTNATVAVDIGDAVAVMQGGSGAVTFVGASGVTIRAPFGAATTALYDIRVAVKVDTDEWVVM